MKLETETKGLLESTVRRIVAMRHLPDERRVGVEYELFSHLHGAAEEKARVAGHATIAPGDLQAALLDLGGERDLAAAFIDPALGPLKGAGFWERGIAYVLDLLVVFVGVLATWLLLLFFSLGALRLTVGPFGWETAADVWEGASEARYGPAAAAAVWALFALGAVATFALPIAYFTYFEGSRGRTLGKAALRLRVVKPDGTRIRYRDAFLRNITKMAALPFFPGGGTLLLVDVLGMLYKSENRRVSDRLFETFVVKESH